MLGYNAPNPNLDRYRKKRHLLLDKLARLGQGLSAAQKADFPWFKDAWDEAMLESHGVEWGNVFAMHVQHILDEITAGVTNAFSVMIHKETHRVLSAPALRF